MYRPLKEERQGLRRKQTSYEKSLWSLLRNRRLADFKFRRQYVIEPYITDFCCPDKKVIIELDVAPHLKIEQRARDKKRDYYLEKLGYRIVRIWNSELTKNTVMILDRIEKVLRGGE